MIDSLTQQILVDLDEPEEEYTPPPYGVPGRILFEIPWGYDDIEVLDYDVDTSVFWLHEGLGIEYAIEHVFGLELPGPGRYLLEDVVGHYYRGDGWMTDDNEEWEVGRVLRATDLEVLPPT